MKIEELVPVELNGQRVLTTRQIAEFYGVTTHRIKDNFRYNKEHFVEGVHYFKLEGEELKALKEQVSEAIMKADVYRNSVHMNPATVESLFKASSALILYTVQGAARHCKSLHSDKAWEVFNRLEQFYFDSAAVRPADAPINASSARLDALEAEVEGLKNTFEAWLSQMEKQIPPTERADKLIAIADRIKDDELRDKILCKAANFFIGKNIF